jgi:signal transduction histidine kinase
VTALFPNPSDVGPRWGALANGLTLAGLGLLVYGVIRGIPSTDTSGQKLAAALLLVVAALAWVAWIALRNSGHEVALFLSLLVVAVAGGALAAISATALVFPGVATLAAASRWTIVPAASLGGAGVVAVLVATAVNGNNVAVVWGALAAAFTGVMVGLTRRQAIEHADQVTRLELASDRAQVERTRAELLGERNHMARELHDVLAHTLAALSLQLEAFATIVDAEPGTSPKIREQLDRTRQLVREGLDEARGAVRALRDDAEPLEARLSRLAEQHNAAFAASGAIRPVAPEAALALYRVSQEALTNVVKHAPGATASVHLAFGVDRVTVTIENDVPASNGATNPLGRSGGGYGLRGIAERIALLGGEVEAGAVPGGWRVSATVPAPEVAPAPGRGADDALGS